MGIARKVFDLDQTASLPFFFLALRRLGGMEAAGNIDVLTRCVAQITRCSRRPKNGIIAIGAALDSPLLV